MSTAATTLTRRLAIGLAVALTAALTVVGTAGAAAAPAVVCGATLKANAVLTKDLSCPAGNGITLYRDVRLDLGGHKLTGPGSGTGVTLSYKGGSTVRNGTIQGWATGLKQDGSTYPAYPTTTTVQDVVLLNSPSSFQRAYVGISQSNFTNSPITSTSGGSVVFTAATLAKSDVKADQAALFASTVTGGQVVGTTVLIDDSFLDGAGSSGRIGDCFGGGLTIRESTVTNYRRGISAYYCDLTLWGNTFTNNPGGVASINFDFAGSGQPASIMNNSFTTSGIAIEGGNSMSITDNTFTRNTTGVYIHDPKEGGHESHQSDSVITGNTFSRNSSSGIRSSASSVSIGNNTAVDNGRYGIYSLQARDLGGNLAARNAGGNCFGVACAAP